MEFLKYAILGFLASLQEIRKSPKIIWSEVLSTCLQNRFATIYIQQKVILSL